MAPTIIYGKGLLYFFWDRTYIRDRHLSLNSYIFIYKVISDGVNQDLENVNDNSMDDTRNMLLLLVRGIAAWQNNYSRIPDELYEGMMRFIALSASPHTKPPVDIHQLIRLLHKPSNEWGIPNIQNYYPENAPLLEEFIGLTAEADEFLNMYISPQDAEQQCMFNILKFCRQKGTELQQDYVKIRTFLSNSRNAVLTFYDLSTFAAEFRHAELTELIHQCYEDVTESLVNYRICPHCGWTMEYKKDQWRCNKEDICHWLADMENLKTFDFGSNRVKRLRPGIQRYVLLPGISEIRIAERLLRRGYEVELYPNLDEYDLSVRKNDRLIYLDVKDFRDPSTLANFFNSQSASYLEKYHEKCYIVVPKYRNDRYPMYVDRSMNRLIEPAKDFIRMITEKELNVMLKEALYG